MGNWSLISSAETIKDPVQLGVVALGRAFVLTLPALRVSQFFDMVAACDVRAQPLETFKAEFGGNCYQDLDMLLADEGVEAVYIGSPHQFHYEQAIAVAAAGKHLLLEKPMALTLPHAQQMVTAFQQAGRQLVVGPCHSFDAPVQLAKMLIDSGEFGRVRLIQALNYTDFLFRPRRPEELKTAEGGGVVFSQAVHQVDVVRLLAGGMAGTVYAMTGAWDPDRPSEGAYSALINFTNGIIATLTYSGYAHFDSDEWMDWKSELGSQKQPEQYGMARQLLAGVESSEGELQLKHARTYGASVALGAAVSHEHFGPVIVVCERGDLRLTPDGVEVYADHARRFVAAELTTQPRETVLKAFYQAIRENNPPAQTGSWGLASLEVCHAMLVSAASGQAVALNHQISFTGN